MSTAKEIREQLLKSFRIELAEHIQNMTAGLLKIEQATSTGAEPEPEMLNTTFRAAHSLKGAARAMGVTAIEQLAHAQESILDGLRRHTLTPVPAMFTVFYQSLDAIQAVQAAYEAGETTPPAQALISLMDLEKARVACGSVVSGDGNVQATSAAEQSRPPAADPLAPNGAQVGPGTVHSNSEETVRVDVNKLDALMANLSDLLIARIRLEQRRNQIGHLREQFNNMQRSWIPVRGPFSRLMREEEDGLLSLHRPISVDAHDLGSGKSLAWDVNLGLSQAARTQEENNAETAVRERKELVEVSKNMAMLLRYISTSQGQIQEMHAQLEALSRQYTADTLHLSLVIDALDDDIKRLRLLSFHTITSNFARMVRDLAHQSGKEAVLTILGSDTEIDKRVLEGLKDPLIHLLRNAIDHGIEAPEIRQAAGKPRAGQITISVERVGKDIIFRVADDGAGIDIDVLRQVVAKTLSSKRGGIDPQVMNESELIDSMFSLGISTSRMITDVSGRGVGLSVVRSNIEALQGRISVEYQPGQGTVFSLFLPLTLTGMRGLLVRAAGQMFAVPINSIERTLRVGPNDISTLEGHDVLTYEGRPIPLVRLSEALELAADTRMEPASLTDFTAVILTVNDRFDDRRMIGQQARRMAFIIDELAGEQEIVIKDLGKQLTRVGGIAGATVMGSGDVVLVLHAADLMKLAARRGGSSILDGMKSQAAAEAGIAPKTILVVDDSITTRTLERNILETAGYQVLVATDGYEALDVIRSSSHLDLVVTDIVMPRMDGLELTHQIKSNPQTAHLPVILVTSLESAEDKKRGIEVQADAYIVKSRFDQANLLETIQQLI
jgi:two-component system chemotaxis sensor kinase CheA